MDNRNNTGKENSGNLNSGYRNSGSLNSGYRNSGDRNSGDWNSGNWNSGNRNSGYLNSGNLNSGDRNSGYRNSGDRNSGSLNSGSLNSGNLNSGYLNTNEPPLRVCNIMCDVTRSEYESTHGAMPIYPLLTEWIESKDMTAEEKKKHPDYANTTGCLRTYGFKDAYRLAWGKASEKEKQWFYDLPNFNRDIFFEITGVDLRANVAPSLSGQKVTVTVGDKTYSATID